MTLLDLRMQYIAVLPRRQTVGVFFAIPSDGCEDHDDTTDTTIFRIGKTS